MKEKNFFEKTLYKQQTLCYINFSNIIDFKEGRNGRQKKKQPKARGNP